MKQQTTNNKQFLKIFLVFLTITFYSNDIFSQQSPFGVPYYSNCYQIVAGNFNSTNNKFKFLNNLNGRTIQMISTNPLDIIGFDVYYKKYNDEWEYYAGYVNLGDSYYANPTVKSIIIVPDNNSGGAANYGETEIEFVDFDFEIE